MPSADLGFPDFYRAELAPQVRRAFLMLGDNEQANDVVAEAMAAVYRNWAVVDTPGAYLNRAVLNGCRDVGRRRVTRRRLLDRITTKDEPAPTNEVLTDVLAALPFNHRAAVVLRYYAGYTTTEIADALDCAVGSVGPWIERGLAAMRKVL